MRSDLVFSALLHIPNRFLLAKLASKATRALHRPGTRVQDTTNDVLERFSRAKSIADVQAPLEHEILPVRRKKSAPSIRHAPICPTPAQISRVDRASIELGRILGDPPAQSGVEPFLDSGVLN